jgi:membrane protein YqaA with SNARE-associated domain
MKAYYTRPMESADAGLAALFVSAFVSATVLPGNSEVVLFAFLKVHPDLVGQAIALATLANTLGGMTTYALGRLVPATKSLPERAADWVRRYGAAALLLSWAPFIGDALCAAAGWLRVRWWTAAAAMAAGKAARYAAIAWATA